MRPAILYPLFVPVTALPGVGPRLAVLIERLAGPHAVDVLWHLPSGVIDRRFAPTVAEAPADRIATLTVRIEAHQRPATSRQPYRVRASDATGAIDLVYFHARPDVMERRLPVGATLVVSGRVERFGGHAQIVHPDHVASAEERGSVEIVEPVYPMTGGLQPKVLRRAVTGALAAAPALPEWLDPALKNRENWADWQAAIRAVHAPADETDLQPATPARRRLAYDELLANQLALALVRHAQRRVSGRRITGDGRLRRPVLDALPYALTGAQRRTLDEIAADMAGESRMLRLLQGDVGSGKTIVALLTMLIAVEAGHQAALMAPTEILARQHLETLEPLARAAGVEIGILTGRDKGAARARVLERLADGSLPLVVGTHALFQDDVAFADLALAVIDEQHRFGVHQRLQLSAKNRAVDVLVMTATPIPRTLTLTAYGDMDVSRLDEKPPGRQPVDTRTVALDRLEEVVDAVARRVADGAQAYWICPLIEESETTDLAAATERHALLEARLGIEIGLVHGRMKPAERDRVMARFAAGAVRVLVATTVVEVGVNVPAATLMVIEHAERFGLAQLHQLRGRIGRGTGASTCLLLYDGPLGETARARLRILRETEDGFRIAEEDLRLRGAGEVLGTKQSGLPQFRLADLAAHDDLLAIARDDARLILERDPDLAGERGQALRVLLYLFERDAAVRYLRSG